MTMADSNVGRRYRPAKALADGATNQNPKGIGFWALVAEDYQAHGRDLFSQGFITLFWHRFGNWRMSVRWRLFRAPLSLVYRIGAKLAQFTCGIHLPYSVGVGRRVILEHFGGMILVARAIGDDTIIRQNTTFGVRRTGQAGWPTIGNRVDIGAGAVITGEITIGDDAVIGANSVVTRSVNPGDTVVGAPARVIKTAQT